MDFQQELAKRALSKIENNEPLNFRLIDDKRIEPSSVISLALTFLLLETCIEFCEEEVPESTATIDIKKIIEGVKQQSKVKTTFPQVFDFVGGNQDEWISALRGAEMKSGFIVKAETIVEATKISKMVSQIGILVQISRLKKLAL